MRNDLDSLNPGKAMAQASHASNQFVHNVTSGSISIDKELYNMWSNETTQGFGTVLVLSVNEAQLQSSIMMADKHLSHCGIVHDPTYPIQDGDVVHHIPLDTCGYVFGDKDDPVITAILGLFPLHP
tara:strand:- start:3414 stop:3791 length:378 start_codon:yes stop_codon:yes gene_type:complete